jgi:Cys-rich repeat protein
MIAGRAEMESMKRMISTGGAALVALMVLAACSGRKEVNLNPRDAGVELDAAGGDVRAVPETSPSDVKADPGTQPLPDVGEAGIDVGIEVAGPEQVGVDLAADGPAELKPDVPEGCCASDADCPDGLWCVPQFEQCVIPPEPGRCWNDKDCQEGETCHGAFVCPCQAECQESYMGPGVCVPPAGCAALKPAWVEEICDAKGLVLWDGEQCVATCLGCCGCEPFCDYTFESLEECEAACKSADCPTFIGARAECAFQWAVEIAPPSCPFTFCMDKPCESDDDCPLADSMDLGPYCVLGDCAYCWEDAQCAAGEVCRTGRCVPDAAAQCLPAPDCSGPMCHLITPSESPCPVCICDSAFGLECSEDFQCQLLSSHPYMRCVWGRCAECRNDEDCGAAGLVQCLPPGQCAVMFTHPSETYGTWLVGWPGGYNHYSYFRIEPDGTLRRGSYTPEWEGWADDIPPLCLDADKPTGPFIGTWLPEMTESGFLVLRMSLNAPCMSGAGWSNRFLITLSEGGYSATWKGIDEDVEYMASRMQPAACSFDFTTCNSPETVK